MQLKKMFVKTNYSAVINVSLEVGMFLNKV